MGIIKESDRTTICDVEIPGLKGSDTNIYDHRYIGVPKQSKLARDWCMQFTSLNHLQSGPIPYNTQLLGATV
jgi:hypothetical protein